MLSARHYIPTKHLQSLPTALTFLFSLLLLPVAMEAQYAPQAGLEGSTAIAADSSLIIAWAQSCQVERGPLDIADEDAPAAGSGTTAAAVGAADGTTLSLGDGGSAVLTFAPPIRDEEGYDFAVFENGFGSPDGDFLELAFVEVSSDGTNFYRFPAASLTQDTIAVGSFGTLEAEKINNLAGKYYAGFGVPFDLAELVGIPELDIQNITHVRVVDVIGTLAEEYASIDSEGNKINDPYPTAFPSCGFDLDAVGVIHQQLSSAQDIAETSAFKVYPNPVTGGQEIHLESSEFDITLVSILSAAGVPIQTYESMSFQIPDLPTGIYFLEIRLIDRSLYQKIILN